MQFVTKLPYFDLSLLTGYLKAINRLVDT